MPGFTFSRPSLFKLEGKYRWSVNVLPLLWLSSYQGASSLPQFQKTGIWDCQTCSWTQGRCGEEGQKPGQLKPSYVFSQHFPSSLPTPNSTLSMVFCHWCCCPALPRLGCLLPPPCTLSQLAQGLTSKHKTFLPMSPHARTGCTKQLVLE